MIRDLVRTACVIATMAVAAALVIEVRCSLAAIDLAHRQAATAAPVYVQATPPAQAPGPLARLGAATVGLADAALGVVR